MALLAVKKAVLGRALGRIYGVVAASTEEGPELSREEHFGLK